MSITRESAERFVAQVHEDDPKPEQPEQPTTWQVAHEAAKLWLGIDDEDPTEILPVGKDPDEGEDADSSPDPGPTIETDEDRLEQEAARRRLEWLDPADADEIRKALDSGRLDEDNAAIAAWQLANIEERGDLAHLYSPQIAEEIASASQEMIYLTDELDRPVAAMSKRERDAKETAYLELARRVPVLQAELKRRRQDAILEESRRKVARQEAIDQIAKQRKDAWEEAKAKKLQPAKVQQLEWEKDQPIREVEISDLADKFYTRRRKEQQLKAAKNYAKQAATERWRYSAEVFDPRVTKGAPPRLISQQPQPFERKDT